MYFFCLLSECCGGDLCMMVKWMKPVCFQRAHVISGPRHVWSHSAVMWTSNVFTPPWLTDKISLPWKRDEKIEMGLPYSCFKTCATCATPQEEEQRHIGSCH